MAMTQTLDVICDLRYRNAFGLDQEHESVSGPRPVLVRRVSACPRLGGRVRTTRRVCSVLGEMS